MTEPTGEQSPPAAPAPTKKLPIAPLALEQAPPRLVGPDGAPVAGTWSGSAGSTSFAGLSGAYARSFLERRLVEKKWQYLSLATPQYLFAFAIIDTGYLASGLCALFDRGARRLLIDDNPVLPPGCASVSEEANDGLRARLVGPGIRASIERHGGRVLLSAKWGRASIDLSLDARAAPPALSALCPLGPGRFDFTQKMIGLPAEGEIRVGNATFLARGELAGLDYTHGYLERDTSWRWAFASGRLGSHPDSQVIGFNFSEGFLPGGLGENVVWIDGAPRAVGPVSFQFDEKAALAPWQVQSADGSVELTFAPEGMRTQNTDLKLVSSRYLQPFGSFSGHVTSGAGERIRIEALAGVTEDHSARW